MNADDGDFVITANDGERVKFHKSREKNGNDAT